MSPYVNCLSVCICIVLLLHGIVAGDDVPESTSTTITTTTTANESSTIASIGSSTITAPRAVKYLIADDIPSCHQSNANLGDCIKRTLEIMIPRLRDGNKELNIPAMDPFALNRTSFQYTNGPVSGRITMRNALVHGFSQIEQKSLDMKVNKNKIKMRMHTYAPRVRIAGLYKADMAFNNVRVKPRGAFNVTLVDVNLEQIAEGGFYEMDGHRFVRLTKFDVDPKIGDLQIQADGIFPDASLNELVLNVANQYWRQIYRIMLPETRQYWAPMLLRVLNEALTVVPFDAYVKNE